MPTGEFYVLGAQIAPQEVERCRDKLKPVVEQFAMDMNPERVKAMHDSIAKVRAGQ